MRKQTSHFLLTKDLGMFELGEPRPQLSLCKVGAFSEVDS